MVSETSDVRSFLAQQAVFQHLSESNLRSVSDSSVTAFAKSGTLLNFSDVSTGDSAGLIVVRSGSLEIRNFEGELIDRLSEGGFLLTTVFQQASCKNYRISVLEDCLYYELPYLAYSSLYKTDRYFAYLMDSRALQLESGELQTALTRPQSPRDYYLEQSVADYMAAPAICAAPDITIREAARIMRDSNISSLLLSENTTLVGIVTDRDLRTRVLAEGVVDSELIAHVMTTSPHCIEPGALLHQAQLVMMSAHIHHLPVVEDGKPIGIIGLTDIVRANNIEPVSLTGSIKHAAHVKSLRDIAGQFPELVVTLIERHTRAVDMGEIITSLTDGITRRLIQLAQMQLGDAPCNFAWLSFGSQARQEQMLVSDQDNALIIENGELEKHADYFRKLAEFVNDGLHQCGVVLCPGDVMARNPQWRMTLNGWITHFNQWIEQPSPKALMHASIFFDMRHIAGESDLTQALRNTVLEKAKGNTIFLALMSDNALKHSPPLGFFKKFVLEKDGDHNKVLDLKKRGTIPIVDIARNYALSAGLHEVTTMARLKASAQAGIMSQSLASSLIDAHEFIAGIRLESQANQYRQDVVIDNHLDPIALSPLVRHQLKEAFHLVRQAQAAMRLRFGGGLL